MDGRKRYIEIKNWPSKNNKEDCFFSFKFKPVLPFGHISVPERKFRCVSITDLLPFVLQSVPSYLLCLLHIKHLQVI